MRCLFLLSCKCTFVQHRKLSSPTLLSIFSLSKKSHAITLFYLHSIPVSLQFTPSPQIFPFDVSEHTKIQAQKRGLPPATVRRNLLRKKGKKIPPGIKMLVHNLEQAAKWVLTSFWYPCFTPRAACRSAYPDYTFLILVCMVILGSCKQKLLIDNQQFVFCKTFLIAAFPQWHDCEKSWTAEAWRR